MKHIPIPTIGHFDINSEGKGVLIIKGGRYRAFSGDGKGKNDFDYQCTPGLGPIPEGSYYIIDKIYGRYLGSLIKFYDSVIGYGRWFTLLKLDEFIDDFVILSAALCGKEVTRGQFRIHPIGVKGISEGCITLYSGMDFMSLSSDIRDSESYSINTVSGVVKAWGILEVRRIYF